MVNAMGTPRSTPPLEFPVVTSATLLETGALLVVTMFAISHLN